MFPTWENVTKDSERGYTALLEEVSSSQDLKTAVYLQGCYPLSPAFHPSPATNSPVWLSA